MRCDKDHQFLTQEGDGNEFMGPHIGCGGRITSSSAEIDEEGMKEVYNCRICGGPEQAHYCEPTKTEMTKGQLCFMCHFWQEKIGWREENRPDCFVIEGHHYKVNPDAPKGAFGVGFGGSKFHIKPNDGRSEIVTKNLWHQGDVPERFRDVLTDNAIFIRD